MENSKSKQLRDLKAKLLSVGSYRPKPTWTQARSRALSEQWPEGPAPNVRQVSKRLKPDE